jgi:hypothetical protein
MYQSPRYIFIVPSLSIVFAAISCIAWHYDDSGGLSLIEVVFWRLSSFAGVGSWLISAQSLLTVGFVSELKWIKEDSFFYKALRVWMLSLWALIYVLLRIASFIIAIRELTVGAGLLLDTPHWTYSIPHI